MSIIPKIAKAMQTILTTNADKRAVDVGLIKRQRKFSGSTFAQTLVFGWLNKPDATLSDLTQTAADLGVTVSPQGLDERFTYQSAEFLKLILEDTVSTLISADPVAISILQRFHGVYIKDSSIVMLPDELHDTWQGCGGRVMKNTRASVKIQLRVNMNTGGLDGPHLTAGRAQDKSSCFQEEHTPAGSLEIFDLGYFSLKVMEDMSNQGVFWLSRIHTQCDIYYQGERWDLVEYLQCYCAHELDAPILLGVKARLPCRLLAVRVPDKVASERRRKIRAEYKREGKTPSRRQLALLAQESVFIGDGSKWIWNIAKYHFPEAVHIVDWYHAEERLWAVGRSVYGEGTTATKKWVKKRLNHLAKGKVDLVISSLSKLSSSNPEVVENIEDNITYFTNNKERMRYNEYREKGYHIGSGVIESACKHVVGQRLKQAGMTWSVEGADAIIQLRILWKNGKWDTFWKNRKIAV